jgi:hypothetical protein
MIQVKIRIMESFDYTPVFDWMDENVGKFGIDWEWNSMDGSAKILVSEKATLVALIWS